MPYVKGKKYPYTASGKSNNKKITKKTNAKVTTKKKRGK